MTLTTPRQLRNGVDTTISSTAVLLLPANNARIGLILQETGSAQPIRFGDADVIATTGIFVAAGLTVTLQGEVCPTGPIYAIRDGGTDGQACATEIVG